MKLNRIEFIAMNSPFRVLQQRYFAARRLLELGGTLAGGVALEVGCGRGVGIDIILKDFHADRVEAFDFDLRMIERAKRRTAKYSDAVSLWTGDVCSIPKPDASCDAVFDFGIVHHIPDWRFALSEIHRVLKPGGRFYAEEVFGWVIHRIPWRWLAKHPTENMFDAAGFEEGLAAAGFYLKGRATFSGCFGYFVAEKKRA